MILWYRSTNREKNSTEIVRRPAHLLSENHSGQYDFGLGDTYGLYNTHWKDYLYWWQSIKRPAKDYYAMSLQELLSVKFWEKYRADGQNFLFRNINLEIDFARDIIRIGECDIYLS